MAIGPNKKGSIKDVVDEDTYTADRLENYIDIYILNSKVLPVKFMVNEYVNDAVIAKLEKRYLNAGWKGFSVRHAGDSRGDSYCYFELRK